jgi:hypothetical protein
VDPCEEAVRVATALLTEFILSVVVLIAETICPICVLILSRQEFACSNACCANVEVCKVARLLRLSQ